MIRLNHISATRGDFRMEIESLELKQGELVAVLGNNGSGKSTFLSILSGFLAYEGRYLLLQNEFKSYTQKERNRLTGLLLQKTGLNMPFDVFYVILTGRFSHTDGFRYARKDRQSTQEVIRLFDIEHLQDRPFNQLSGGEKQRALLARTFNRDTPILLLDEPLNGIDLKHQHETVRQLHQFKKDKTILVVMHDLSLALREFDRFIVFSQGKLVYDAVKSEIDTDILAGIFQVEIACITHKNRAYIHTALSD